MIEEIERIAITQERDAHRATAEEPATQQTESPSCVTADEALSNVDAPAVEGDAPSLNITPIQDEMPASATQDDTAEEPEPTEEELELAEHNALARAFDEVRRQSRDGKLVTPEHWEEAGVIPAHMDAEEFEMFVYEYWEEHSQAGFAPVDTPLRTVDLQANGESSHSSSSTHAVGVPPFLRNQDASSQKAPQSSQANKDNPAISPAPLKQADDPFKANDAENPDETGEGIPAAKPDADTSQASPLEYANPSPVDENQRDGLDELDLPEGYTLVELEGEWVLVPDRDAKPKVLDIDCETIAALVGAHSYYLYDRSVMTDAFAHWAFLSAEDNDMITFVDCVREDSRIYPRPMPLEALENDPFNFDRSRILAAWDAVQESGEYPDIRQVSASNGDVYFYSTTYLSPAYAASLAEWAAVERFRNL